MELNIQYSEQNTFTEVKFSDGVHKINIGTDYTCSCVDNRGTIGKCTMLPDLIKTSTPIGKYFCPSYKTLFRVYKNCKTYSSIEEVLLNTDLTLEDALYLTKLQAQLEPRL